MKKAVPKLVGIETEYGVGGGDDTNGRYGRNLRAAELVLSYSGDSHLGFRREFLPNGARLYCDHTHVEYSTPETRCARTLVAAVKAGDLIVSRGAQLANSRLGDGRRVVVLANNSDGQGHSYAGHLNFLVSRDAFDDWFNRRPHVFYMYWIPHLVTAQLYTGAGKIGAENGASPVLFQLSQRADFMETAAIELQTTHHRPLVNARDEALADPRRFARLHVIAFDTNMVEYALWLKIGTAQLVLAMMEAGFIRRSLALEDPVQSMREISRDLTLRRKLAMEDGTRMTALDIQEELLLQASRFVARGFAEDLVPEAKAILEAWTETLVMLRNKRQQLIGRVDWITKLWLMRLHRQRHGVEWSDPSMRAIDLQYHNLDPEEGIYHSLVKGGLVVRVVTDREIERLVEEAPSDSRAYFRGLCLKKFPGRIVRLNWDGLELCSNGVQRWWRTAWLSLPDPLRPLPESVKDVGSIDVDELLAVAMEEDAKLRRRKDMQWTYHNAYEYDGGN
ncbi:MAG: proteasome accessory factor PafA2 family protein [Candidatus Hadarchaeum sp.]